MWKPALIGVAVVAVLTAGCTSGGNETTPKDTAPADVTACHDFGSVIIQHGSSASNQAILDLTTELQNAANASLQKEGANLKPVVTGDAAARLKYEDQIAATCYRLHLISSNGAPL